HYDVQKDCFSMPKDNPHQYDAVVIGSGHNGLIAAAYLAKAGQSVLVLEKNNTFGGATASQRIFPDYDALLSRYSYLVSLLPHRITDDLRLDFKSRRRSTASFTPWCDVGGRQRGLVLSNVDEHRSRDSMFEMTGKHSSWNRYQEFLSLQAEIASIIWPTMLQPLKHRKNFEAELKTDAQRLAWRSFVERPLGESIESYADHDALRGLLLTDGKIGVSTHAHDPALLQNRCFLYHIIGNQTGEWRVPVGGMKQLVDSLLLRCKDFNVDFVANAPATHIEVGKNQHSVTFETNGQAKLVAATNVLVNAGPRTFASLLNQSWSPSEPNDGSVFKMNMLLRRLPSLKATGVNAKEAFSGSLHIDEGYEQLAASFNSASKGEVPIPPPGEVYCHTLTDDSILSDELAQKGYQTLTLFGLDMPWRLFESNHDQTKARVTQLYLDGLNQLCAEPIEECLAIDANGEPCIEAKTPQELQTEIDLDRGNIFHNELSWFYGNEESQGTWGVETEFPRIYRAGSSATRGGAVSGIPGHNAAMCILEKQL
ncbi:MAG: NAD(P)/FAD-dependent oxidoreductase, partial [Planctomycetota bacterium]